MKILGQSIPTLALSALLLSGAAALSAGNSAADAVPPQDAFTPIERYGITYDKPRDIAEFYLNQFGLHRNDANLREVRHPSDRSMRILIVTVDEVEDPSVTGVQWRLGARFSEGQWQAIEAGMRRKCARGENAGEWTKSVCP
ncbi:MAG: hypothetical protein HKP43_02625 [Altererythrobacter sp.]|nr:hypothetical protein [Altererythrobacter sp.]MBT8432700.1 hypothetical protein [Altererythrobacter sp.]NNE50657.1 hypothetical protein [Altererythrobacter sp.]NNF94893.1 hypothetical protein [Altererythrobacter sp.]NNK45505.1 hypothetical protein [Altererythrobacter sp.]